jgi:arylsulfatase A-like enzyme
MNARTKERVLVVAVVGVIAVAAVVLVSRVMPRARRGAQLTLPALPPAPEWLGRISAETRATRPNILLVVYDVRRRDDFSFGARGNARNDTPYLARMSRESLFFENAVSPACWTIPAHASMFSGLSVCQLGIDRYSPSFISFRGPFLSLAEALALSGYRTIAYADHPYFFNNRDPGASLIRGFSHVNVVNDFERYASYTNVGTRGGRIELTERLTGMPPLSAREVEQTLADYQNGRWQAPRMDEVDRDPATGVLFPRLGGLCRNSAYFAKRYQDEFDSVVFQSPAEPFFLFLNLHMSFVATPDPALVERFLLQTLLLNAAPHGHALSRLNPAESVADLFHRNYVALKLPYAPFASPYQYVKQAFDNRLYDATFEAICAYLERRGLMKNTVTIVTSDHGFSLGEHGERLFFHDGARPYEYLIRVPLVVRFPADSPLARLHGRRQERVSLTDLFPTTLELAVGRGVFEREQRVAGMSLTRRIEEGSFDSMIVSESSLLPARYSEWSGTAGHSKALLWDRYKLIHVPEPYRQLGDRVWPDTLRLGAAWPFATSPPAFERAREPITLLFDLDRDPAEAVNLAAKNPAVVRRLLDSCPVSWACSGEALKPADSPHWSEETRKTLKALGYIE